MLICHAMQNDVDVTVVDFLVRHGHRDLGVFVDEDGALVFAVTLGRPRLVRYLLRDVCWPVGHPPEHFNAPEPFDGGVCPLFRSRA